MKFFSRPILALLFSAFLGQSLFSQNISGTINEYAKITAMDTCTGQLTVGSTAGFQPGMAVILIQMQGASVSSGNNSDFGKINAINSCGLFEGNEVVSVVPPSTVFLKFKLTNKYDVANGAVQLVSFPKYQNATIADTLFPKKWDGATGGILAISAQKLTFNAPIDGSGRGFRGAVATTISGNNCTWTNQQDEFTYGPNNWRGALKGEGIAPFFNDKEAGRGPQANGGGGGNDHNSGGGGGANTQPGGKGGKNDEPANFGCKGNNPGLGGLALPGSATRLFMGGGGGAGHGNNSTNGSGGAGGGIVIVIADSIDGTTALNQLPNIWVNGRDGDSSAGDGAGGGGAGGTIFLQFKTAMFGIALNLAGNNGGSNDAGNQDRCQGPGGGGAGGRAYSSLGLGAAGVIGYGLSGGSPGQVFNSTNGCNGSTNGATKGTDGVFTQISMEIPASPIKFGPLTVNQQPLDVTVCAGENRVLSTMASGNDFTYQWQVNTGSGWADILSANTDFAGSKTAILTILNTKIAQNGHKFRCKLHPTACSTTDVFSEIATLTVLAKPVVAFVFSVNNSLLATFTNLSLNAQNFLWNFGDGTPTSTLTNPGHTYSMPGNYTVTLTGWNSCDTIVFTQNIVVQSAPLAGFMVENPVFGCGNSVEVQFQNSSTGNITGQNWQFPGGVPVSSNQVSPLITYSSSGSYTAKLTVTGASGSTNSTTQNFDVELAQFPNASFTASLNGNWVTFTNTSVGGATYFWDFGDTQSATTFDALHVFPQGGEWLITLVVQNACGASVYQQIITLQWSATDDFAERHGFRVFPNPSDGLFFVETKDAASANFGLQLVDLQGRMLFEKEIYDERAALDLVDLPPGVYFLKITGADGQAVRRLVKI